MRFEAVGGRLPVLIVDGLYEHPDAIREMALGLDYAPPPYPYPGRLAVPAPDPSLERMRGWALDLINSTYLPRVPPITDRGRHIAAFGDAYTDFAVVDVHPDELSSAQRMPHVDPVPLFGLVYLNREPRGGTLFFEQTADAGEDDRGHGYFTGSDDRFSLIGRIEAAFNRLAIYPGFVPHSGDISGDWIASDDRFTSPRLTQRLVFQP